MATEHTTSKTKFYIATTPATAALDTLSEYEALTWTQVKSVYDLGEFGDMDEAVEVKAIGQRTVRVPGSTDGGMLDLIVNRLSNDPGQALLATAKGVRSGYPFKVLLDDKLTSGGGGSEFYFIAVVLGGRLTHGETDNVVRITWSLAINSERLEVVAD